MSYKTQREQIEKHFNDQIQSELNCGHIYNPIFNYEGVGKIELSNLCNISAWYCFEDKLQAEIYKLILGNITADEFKNECVYLVSFHVASDEAQHVFDTNSENEFKFN